MKHNAHIGYVYFKDDTQALAAAQQFANGRYGLYYRRSVLLELVDMLRNEAPVYLHWIPEGTNNTRISTTAELVGEEEM